MKVFSSGSVILKEWKVVGLFKWYNRGSVRVIVQWIAREKGWMCDKQGKYCMTGMKARRLLGAMLGGLTRGVTS